MLAARCILIASGSVLTILVDINTITRQVILPWTARVRLSGFV